MTLAEFLLDRLNEIEAAACEDLDERGRPRAPIAIEEARAWRDIVQRHRAKCSEPCEVLRHLGTEHAGHPDYDEAWRP